MSMRAVHPHSLPKFSQTTIFVIFFLKIVEIVKLCGINKVLSVPFAASFKIL